MRSTQTSLRRTAVLGLWIILCTWAATALGQAPKYTFENPVVRISSSDNTGEIIVVGPPAKAVGLVESEPLPSTPESSANNPPATGANTPPKIIFTLTGEPSATTSQWVLRYHFSVKFILPANSAQRRIAKVTIGGIPQEPSLLYWLTNRSGNDLALSIATPIDPWVVHGVHPWDASSRCTTVSVNSGELPAYGVRLLQSTLVASSKRPLGLDRFRLCADSHDCKGTQPLDLVDHKATQVWICLDNGFLAAGKYSGKLTLGTAQKAETQTLDLNLWASDLSLRTLGFLLIALGVYGSYWLKVASKARLDRLQALAPAAYLRTQIADLDHRLKPMPAAYRAILTELLQWITDAEASLTEDALDGQHYLPPKTPLLIGVPPQIEANGFKAFLERLSLQLATLRELVVGVEEIRKIELGPAPPPLPAAVTAAVTAIEQVAGQKPLPDADTARHAVATALATLQAARAEGFVALAGPVGPVPFAPVNLSYEQIQIQTEHLSRAAWLVWGGLTLLAGLAYLILGNPGFGTPLDLVFALFWSFGIPTVLSQLSGANAVSSALGVSVVRPA